MCTATHGCRVNTLRKTLMALPSCRERRTVVTWCTSWIGEDFDEDPDSATDLLKKEKNGGGWMHIKKSRRRRKSRAGLDFMGSYRLFFRDLCNPSVEPNQTQKILWKGKLRASRRKDVGLGLTWWIVRDSFLDIYIILRWNQKKLWKGKISTVITRSHTR